jgi:hypothetical protein
MKTRNFYVPVESIIEFAEIIEENDLKGVILGADAKEEELAISVEFEEEDSAAILEMIEYIESINDDDDD